MPFPLTRWSILLLLCLLAPTAFAAGKAKRAKAKVPWFLRIQGGHKLYRPAALAFERMSGAASKEGVRLWVTSSTRSRKQQRFLYDRYRKGLGPKAARPGRSLHQRGLAVDLYVGDEGSSTHDWLSSNACRFGFRRTVPSEPWHWEYRPRTTPPPESGEDCLGQPVPEVPASGLPSASADPS